MPRPSVPTPRAELNLGAPGRVPTPSAELNSSASHQHQHSNNAVPPRRHRVARCGRHRNVLLQSSSSPRERRPPAAEVRSRSLPHQSHRAGSAAATCVATSAVAGRRQAIARRTVSARWPPPRVAARQRATRRDACLTPRRHASRRIDHATSLPLRCTVFLVCVCAVVGDSEI